MKDILDTQLNPATVSEILGYFVRNPQAADSLEGVARWRLLNEYITRKVDETQRALAWLVAQGYLRETSSAGSGPIYSLNPDKVDQACEFLARPDAGAAGPKA